MMMMVMVMMMSTFIAHDSINLNGQGVMYRSGHPADMCATNKLVNLVVSVHGNTKLY